MKRILIIGCSGSGKTTLAQALGEKLELPVISLDGLWSGNATKAEFDSRLERALSLESWIMDGNYGRTMDARLSRCDTLIYLDFGRFACLQGLLQRRPVPWHRVKEVWHYRRKNHTRDELYLAKAQHAQRLVLKSRKEVQDFLNTI